MSETKMTAIEYILNTKSVEKTTFSWPMAGILIFSRPRSVVLINFDQGY